MIVSSFIDHRKIHNLYSIPVNPPYYRKSDDVLNVYFIVVCLALCRYIYTNTSEPPHHSLLHHFQSHITWSLYLHPPQLHHRLPAHIASRQALRKGKGEGKESLVATVCACANFSAVNHHVQATISHILVSAPSPSCASCIVHIN